MLYKNVIQFLENDEYIEYKGVPLCNVSLISQGSYGKVYRFTSKDKKYTIVLKDFFNNNDGEIKVVNYLEKHNIDCNLINHRLLKSLKNK